MAHRLTFWENKEITFEESKKYSSRSEFYRNSHGAYVVSKNRGWLDEMVWLNRKNVYKDLVDVVYKYYFATKNAIYVGRTIYPELRDKQHRTREKDTVYKFSKDNNIEIPEMEIVEKGLTVSEGAKRERYWAEYYKNKGLILINKQPCGSLGLMCKGKWSKEKCFEESKKYKTRSEFQKNASQAYHVSIKKGWINDMDWFPKNRTKPNGYWKNKENFLEEARKYNSKKELEKGCLAAYVAGLKYGYFDECVWFENRKCLPFGYWKNKEHVFEESKKYKTRNDFRKGNQSAYWAALKYGYLEEIPWLKKKNTTVARGYWKNKEIVIEEGKKYKTRGEFQKHNKNAYSAALRYGWLSEMDWMLEDKKFPRGYWNKIENVINEAKKYKSKKELKENNSYLYKIMFKNGYIEKLDWLK